MIDRRGFIGAALAALVLRSGAGAMQDENLARLRRWVGLLRGMSTDDIGALAAAAGEQAVGSPYVAGLLDAYAAAGGDPAEEPLVLDLTRFDCVLLVEGCLAVARVAARGGEPSWDAFAREIERMRYRGGVRDGYPSRLHYFSEWIADNARRGLLRDVGQSLGAEPDVRPLRFMTSHRGSYPALRSDTAFERITAMERSLDASPRWVVPTARIAAVQDGIRHGDVLAFATRIEGLDATHTGFAYRDGRGTLRVLHAPLSGGAVEVSRATLVEYVAAIRSATGIMIARPLLG